MEETAYQKVGHALAENPSSTPDIGLKIRYGVDDLPRAVPAALFALQHVLIMFSAMIASPLIIGQVLGLSPELRAALLTGVILGCGIGTIISALGVGWVGARLPLLLGAYTVYVVPVVTITRAESGGAATGAMLTGGLFLVAISPVVARLRPLFPPVVVGALLVLTGLTLLKIAMGVAFGVNTPYSGHPVTLAFLVASIVVIAIVASVPNPLVRSLSILIALVMVYLAGLAVGLGNFSAIAAAPWFRIPSLLPFGIAWPSASGIVTMVIYNAIAAIYTMSITLALCAMIKVEPTERRIRGAVAGDGVGSVLSVLLGGVPLISYDQNVGAISLTGVASRFVVALSGAILVAMAFLPKIAAVIGMVPPFVLGGTLVFMFGLIAVVGIQIISQSANDQRNVVIVAASIGLSAVVNFAPASTFEMIPAGMRMVAGDGIVVGTLTAVILNLLIRRRSAAVDDERKNLLSPKAE
jgi:uracil-xanthine permease